MRKTETRETDRQTEKERGRGEGERERDGAKKNAILEETKTTLRERGRERGVTNLPAI